MGIVNSIRSKRSNKVNLSSAEEDTMFNYLRFCLVVVHLGWATAQEANCAAGKKCFETDTEIRLLCKSCVEGATCKPYPEGSIKLEDFSCQMEECIKDGETCNLRSAAGNAGTCCEGLECEGGKCKAASTENKCSTTATSEGKASTPCVFPFKHGSKTFTSCTTAGGYQEPWCSTKVDSSGKHVQGNYGTCDMRKCDSCSTTSGAACMIPITYGSKTYLACTKDGGDGKAWCSTKTDKNWKHIAGNYGDCDMTKCSSECGASSGRIDGKS